jgi:hypothetical protein
MGRQGRSRSLSSLAAVGVGGVAGYYFALRPWHMRWGASREEISRPMPGDDLVREPLYVSNRAITIHARPWEIWPWVVQIGMGRAGFYGYQWFERLAEVSISTVEHIIPEFQSLEAGDFIPAGRGIQLPVRSVELNGSLVIGSNPNAPPGEELVSWSLGLYPQDGATRLVSRVRSTYRWKPGAPLATLFQGPLHFILERKMLLGIKQRAEALAAKLTEEERRHTGVGHSMKPGGLQPEPAPM